VGTLLHRGFAVIIRVEELTRDIVPPLVDIVAIYFSVVVSYFAPKILGQPPTNVLMVN